MARDSLSANGRSGVRVIFSMCGDGFISAAVRVAEIAPFPTPIDPMPDIVRESQASAHDPRKSRTMMSGLEVATITAAGHGNRAARPRNQDCRTTRPQQARTPTPVSSARARAFRLAANDRRCPPRWRARKSQDRRQHQLRSECRK